MKRLRLAVCVGGGAYFAAPTAPVFFSSGCTLLDCVLGGGWPKGRIVNIVGDKSTGKTLLAIEAAANFAAKYPEGSIRYNEVEAAFDEQYAEALGLPLDRIDFVSGSETVEDIFEDMDEYIKTLSKRQPGLYILDSLDALTDRDEIKRDLDKGTYGMGKPKMMSRLFRQLVRKMKHAQITFMIISQVRDNIGVTFGRHTTRTGGRALDFYAAQILYLAQVSTWKKMVRGVERPIGVQIKAKCDKNKVGLPFRECEFPILFGFGVDDVRAGLEWLAEIKRLKAVGLDSEEDLKHFFKEILSASDSEYISIRKKVNKVVRQEWVAIEESFLPRRRKYVWVNE